jgi:hypothetical protein
MISRTFIGATPIRERIDVRVDRNSQPNLPALNSLAVGALASLFDEKENLFSRWLAPTESGIRRETPSRKLTAIALLGLARLSESGEKHPFDVSPINDAVWKDRSWVRSIGDLGLLTWFTGACCPDRLDHLLHEYDLSQALNDYSDARISRTTSLALFLAGIAHARLACPNTPWYLTDVAVETYHLLETNCGEGGILGHAAVPKYRPQSVYNRLGTFADQMYAIYAFTAFARAFQIEEPLALALSCANSIRNLQGEMGQWWYLYNKRSSHVVNRYPVFSLNQYGIAPLALLALEEATRQSFHESVYKGLAWTPGANELGDDLRDLDRHLMWDSIRPTRPIRNYWEAALSLINVSSEPHIESLRVQYEARPDHFGWLLYAFGSSGLPNAAFSSRAASTR